MTKTPGSGGFISQSQDLHGAKTTTYVVKIAKIYYLSMKY